MKKFAVILIAVLYTAITSGFTVNLHYCMGKLASVNMDHTPADVCNKCGKTDKGSDCCKNEFKFLKIAEVHQGAKTLYQDAPMAMDLQLPVSILPAPAELSVPSFAAYYHHAPPEQEDIPLFLRNCTFLI
jgi:hypothetical protein